MHKQCVQMDGSLPPEMTLETGEGITASERNANSCPDTRDPLIVFKMSRHPRSAHQDPR
jgi:hypothetical protein